METASGDRSFGRLDRLIQRGREVRDAYYSSYGQNVTEEAATSLVDDVNEVWGLMSAAHGTSEQISADYTKIPGAQAPEGRSWSIDEAIHNWLACVDAFRDPAKGCVLKTAFSETQLKSLALLFEWWDNPSGGTDDIRPWIKAPDHHSPPTITKGRADYHTSYQTALSALWFWEFTIETEPNADFAIIEESFKQRQRAAEAAAAHRTALQSLGHIATRHQHNNQSPVLAFFLSCRWLNVMDRRRKGDPHFLWDMKLRKTVETPRGGVDYLVISHTWGRWLIPGDSKSVPGLPFDTRYVWFDLVCIPQDPANPLMKSEIARQAAIFTNARWATIWCNKVDDWSGLEAAVHWLSSVYIAHSTSFTPELEDSTRRLEEFAVCANRTTQLVTIDKSTSARSDRERLVFPHVLRGKHIVGWYEPDGWFSSLWTLQEACLRPDLHLCDKNWQVARTRGDQPLTGIQGAITLDCLIALFNAALIGISKMEDHPLAIVELIGILDMTGMHKLLGLGPIDVLLLGNQRYCKDTNRAIAVMSAIGTTDWYTTGTNQPDDVTRNVMVSLRYIHQRYPIEFLNEIRSHFGGPFFYVSESVAPRKSRYRFSWWPWKRRIIDTEQKSTMLPLTEDMQFGLMRVVQTDSIHNVDYPTIRTWELNVDGLVSVFKAGIAAASSSRGQQSDSAADGPMATVWACVPGQKQGLPFTGRVHLRKWLYSFRPSAEKYAIVLFKKMQVPQRTWFYRGVLLERVYRGNTRNFISIGVFEITQNEGGFSTWPGIKQEEIEIRVL